MPDQQTSHASAQTHTPLLGKTILVTRAREQASEVIKLLEQLGATVLLFPTIQIVPPDSWEPCDQAIERIDSYNAIVVTSVNAVDNFFSRVNQLNDGRSRVLAVSTLYAVGEKTRHALERYKIPVVPMPDVHDAKQLAIALSKKDVEGKKFLFPKGNLAGDVVTFALREHGAIVDEVTVYNTIQPSSADTEDVKQKLKGKEIDVITFFSPSSISNFLTMIPAESLEEKIIAVIGNTTAAAAKNVSLPVHIVADQATSANMVASIVKFYE